MQSDCKKQENSLSALKSCVGRRSGKLASGAEVWLLDTRPISLEHARSEFSSILCVQEQQRLERFHFEDDRKSYLLSHALLRIVLSLYAGIAPEEWEFTENRYGRPELAGCHTDLMLRFNLSHTDGKAACIVSENSDCGVDIEHSARTLNYPAVAKKMYSDTEVAYCMRNRSGFDTDAFFRLWTLKEAYVKARGIGLSLPTRKIVFDLESGARPTANFDSGVEDDPATWQFSCDRLASGHIVATAIRKAEGDQKLEMNVVSV